MAIETQQAVGIGAAALPGTGAGEFGAAEGLGPETSQARDIWRRFRRNKLAMFGLVVVILEVLGAVFAPLITFYDPDKFRAGAVDTLLSPSGTHWFGTDQQGRDLFTRVVYGARVSLEVGIIALIIALAVGLTFGAIAGYYGRFWDALLMRTTDIFLAFPYILAAIVIISVVGRGVRAVMIVLGLLGWMPFARLFRASVLQIKEYEYVEAARAAGCSDRRIITRHILPNAIQPIIVYGTIFVGTAVLSEAALSFLGAGVVPPTPAWGLMVADGKALLFTNPGLLFFPGAAIFLTVMAFVFVGDGLRDALDPKLR